MKNLQVKSNLEELFNLKFESIIDLSIEEFFDELINENPMAYDISSGEITGLYDEDEIKNFKKAKKNSKLISIFEKAKQLKFNENLIIQDFKKNILDALSEINDKNIATKNLKTQIIFLEHDYQPFAVLCGFGRGNYPILNEPAYFEFNWQEESFCGIGKIDYSKIWDDLFLLNQILEDLDVYDSILDTEFYQNLSDSIKFKTYLLLHEAFNQIGIEAFKGIEIEKPLFIYGNEHDCEAINIFIFE